MVKAQPLTKIKHSLLPAVAALLVSHVAVPTAAAQSQGANAIQGAWTLEVHQQNPPPGVTDFRSLITFSAGGSTVEANGAPGSGPATGVWEFVRAGEFAVTWFKPIYDVSTGAFLGTLKIRGLLRMKSIDEYEGSNKLDFYFANGAPPISWTTFTIGKRIKVEPVD
jgi:hypothetical protein